MDIVNTTCKECQKVFSTLTNLRKHIRNMHYDKANILMPSKKKYKFSCEHCNRNYSFLKHLKYHQKKTHCIDNGNYSVPKKKKCPLCDYTGYEMKDMWNHFTDIHHIEIRSLSYTLASLDETYKWKSKIEHDTNTHFIKNRGDILKNNRKHIHYVCHRSGNFNSQSKGLRKLKIQGSNKIDGFCPATITILVNESGACDITFLETHVGHENDVNHLFLTSAEREALAVKIAQQVPFTDIIREAHYSSQDSDSERVRRITRKDLYNIKQSLKLEAPGFGNTTFSSASLESKAVETLESDEEEEVPDREEEGGDRGEEDDGGGNEEETGRVMVKEEVFIIKCDELMNEEETEHSREEKTKVASTSVLDEQKERLKSYLILEIFNKIQYIEDERILEKIYNKLTEVSLILDEQS